MEFKINAGFDFGNNNIKAYINGRFITQPNVIAKSHSYPIDREVGVDKIVSDLDNNILTSINTGNVTGIYYTGNYALKSGMSIINLDVGAFANKAESMLILPNYLNIIATEAIKMGYEENPKLDEEINVVVSMATSLPGEQYKVKSNRDKLINTLITKGNKKHEVTFHIKEDVKVRVNIRFDYIKVLPEAVPTIFALQDIESYYVSKSKELDNWKDIFGEDIKSKLDGTYFENKDILHNAIGEGTTDVPITHDISFDPNFLESKNYGVGKPIDIAKENLGNDIGKTKIERQDYIGYLINEEHRYNQLAKHYLDIPIEKEAKDILYLIMNEIQRSSNVDINITYGGGSVIMEDALKNKLKMMCDRMKIDMIYIPKEYAIKIESYGLYVFTQGEIFQKLKEKFLTVEEQIKEVAATVE